jgi:prepilin-type N-terminal cleavage/methylation domain-containing protein
MKILKEKNGFTIIETLVAIAILMLAIVGPLTIAHKGLIAAVFAHDQVTAAYLAQDAIEFVKNMRDNNLLANRTDGWLTGFSDCVVSNPCKVDTVGGDSTIPSGITHCSGTEVTTCPLYKTSGGYSPSGSGSINFYRQFYITPRAGNSDEVLATVVMSWRDGAVYNYTAYETELFKQLLLPQ